MSSHSRALNSKKDKYKKSQSTIRKSLRDKGYSSVKEKSYFDYSHKERKNIRDNAKSNSNARKYLGKGAKLKEAFFST